MNRSNKSQSSQKKENSQMFSNMSIRNNTINSSQNQSSNNSVGFLQNTKNQIFKGISNALPKKSTAQQIFRAPVPTWGGFVDPHQISMVFLFAFQFYNYFNRINITMLTMILLLKFQKVTRKTFLNLLKSILLILKRQRACQSDSNKAQSSLHHSMIKLSLC